MKLQRKILAITKMGFAVMETFMDELVVLSEKEIGTKVIMRKTISSKN